MKNRLKQSLFDRIAPIYGLFFNRQKKRFTIVIQRAAQELDLTTFKNMLDVGCGTGALCAVLNDLKIDVTGIDPAEKMLAVARRRLSHSPVRLIKASVLDGLPFADKSFDASITSYVAHGLPAEDRKKLYQEMSRTTRNKVIIYDYNQNRSMLTSLIEWLEKGDYFRFIRLAEKELKNCMTQMTECFSDVIVIPVDKRANWYICTPK